MKVSKKMILVLMSLLSTTFIFAIQDDYAARMAAIEARMAELDAKARENQRVAPIVLKIAQDFEDKYGYRQCLLCTTCKKHTVSVGGVVCYIYIAHIDPWCEDPIRVSKARKLLAEAIEIFPYKELDELLEFLARIANELEMPCDDRKCRGTHWEIIPAEQGA